MLVKTLKRHGYDKRIRVQGEEYEMGNVKHVKLLEACGKIRRVPETPPADQNKQLEVEKPVKKKKKSTKKKGRYKNKNMVSE